MSQEKEVQEMKKMKERKQKLQEIKKMIENVKGFQAEGNLDYAKKCILKVIKMLQDLNKMDPDQAKVYQQKIAKYVQEYKRIQELQAQKAKHIADKPKLKFQIPTSINNIEKKPNNKQLNKVLPMSHQVKIENKKTYEKDQKKNLQIDSEISEMIVREGNLTFNDIVGMKDVKQIIEEAVIKPRKRPDLFKGIRAPPKGILFYGPPGNGKTYIAKALAHQSNCTFFVVSASSIMNKWVGEAEKKLGKLFKTAEAMSPSIIFIDQIDSLLTARSEKQNEVSRRVKTQFLVMMDGVLSAKQGDVLLIGATNLPSQLDLAALRRFNKLIYIGLPDQVARQGMVKQNLKGVKSDLDQNELKKLSELLEGYSASEIKDITKEAAMIPIREISKSEFEQINQEDIRNVNIKDFQKIIDKKKPLLSKEDLKQYQANFT